MAVYKDITKKERIVPYHIT